MRGSIFFPAARGAPENTIDYFIRVLMPREAWMHRTDIAIAALRPVGVGPPPRGYRCGGGWPRRG